MAVAPWIRGLLAVDRAVAAATRAHAALRDELLAALVPASARDDVTAWIYARQSTYFPDGRRFGDGLFDWERAALSRPPFPTSGRILVGGAGAGREVAALLARGHDVVAFDPCAALVAAARRTPSLAPARFSVAGYGDLARPGPLDGLDFDGVVLGWISLSHVLDEATRRTLFPSLRRIAPRAPVLASWFRAGNFDDGRLRERLRRVLGGEPGLRFLPWAGFAHLFADGEVARLAADAGYRVAHESPVTHPHALLVPA